MCILYINSKNVCIVDNNFKKLDYCASRDEADIKQIYNIIKKYKREKLYVFLNSFYSNNAYVKLDIARGNGINIYDFVKSNIFSKNILLSNFNVVFGAPKNIKRLSYKDNIIVTTIGVEDVFISEVVDFLSKRQLITNNVYDFVQCSQSIYMSYVEKNKTLNINVCVLNGSIVITCSNAYNFIFGNTIKINAKDDNSLYHGLANAISMTIKYVETTYENLLNAISVYIIGNNPINIDNIKSCDAILGNVNMEYKPIDCLVDENLHLEDELRSEISLISVFFKNISKVNCLTSDVLKRNYRLSLVNKDLSLFSFFGFLALLGYLAFCFIQGQILNKKILKIANNVSDIKQQVTYKNNELANLLTNIREDSVYLFNQISIDTDYHYPIGVVSLIANKYHNFIDVGGYNFSCKECYSKNKILLLSFDAMFFNVKRQKNIVMMYNKQVLQDIKNELLKKYKNVSVVSNITDKADDDPIFVQEDVEGTIYVFCSNNESSQLPTNSNDASNFFRQ